MITVKVPYITSKESVTLIANLRRQYSSVVRYAFNRVDDGLSQIEIRSKVKEMKSNPKVTWLPKNAPAG
jgi:hypothetical protein